MALYLARRLALYTTMPSSLGTPPEESPYKWFLIHMKVNTDTLRSDKIFIHHLI
jgi:hypothetical protein